MHVQTNQGQKIVDEYFHNQDGHGAFKALCLFCERSGHAELRKQEILDRLTSVCTGQFRNAPLLTFIDAVTALMKEYDDLDPDGGMSEAMKMSIMKNAVSNAPVLHHFANQSNLEVAMGREPLNWYSYLGLLEDAAINQDNTRRYRSDRTGSNYRPLNVHEQNQDDTDDGDTYQDALEYHDDDADETPDLLVNAAEQQPF
jgi:hypothetical protein